MPEPIKISTSKYVTKGKVSIDGNIWDLKLPGAATEMRLSQAFRESKSYAARLKMLEGKIDKGQATMDELDMFDEYSKKMDDNEKSVIEFFIGIFNDGTPDNSEVRAWVNAHPMDVIQKAFDDVKAQANGVPASEGKPDSEAADGREKPTESS